MRFVVIDQKEAWARRWRDEPPFDWEDEYRRLLFDTSTSPPTEIASDGGEPEDQTLYRDWAWVPKLLNKLAEEIERLQATNKGQNK